jgi:predicted enzyme related to lactoylglutathione lyase
MGKKIVHVEFPAQDVDRAEKFWEAVGGWSIEGMGMPGVDYRMYQEGDQGGGVYAGDGGTLVYYGGDDIDADIAKVRGAGGEAEDKQPIPGVGWFTRCKDTEGNSFGLFQSDESVTMPEGAPAA